MKIISVVDSISCTYRG